MKRKTVIHTLYSGLGGHSSVVFPFLENSQSHVFEHVLVFYGVEPLADSTREYVEKMTVEARYLPKKRGQYRKPFRLFKKWLLEYQPTTIIVHNSELLIPALKYRKSNSDCSVVYVEHQDQTKKGFVLKRLSKIAAQKAQAVVCLNSISKEKLMDNYRYHCPIHVIPNGINTDIFQHSEHKRAEIRVLGMASRMVSGKDHPTLLKAFAQVLQKHPHLRLKIAGDGPTLNTTKELAKSLSIAGQVDFLGRINEADMPQFYREIDLYIQASFAETLCTSILQAFATKTPVIASDISNNRSLLDNGNRGFLYPSENPTALAEQIMSVIGAPAAVEKSLRAGEMAIQRSFSSEKMTERYIQLINGKFEQE